MRTLLLTSSAVAVSVGGFIAYLSLHSAPPASLFTAPVSPMTPDPGKKVVAGGVAEGDRPWVSSLDDEGRLQHRVRVNNYQPRGGNRVDVTDVDAEFFQYVKEPGAGPDAPPRTQMIRILGKNGTIEVAEAPRSGVLGGAKGGGKGSGGPPKRGLLNDVTIEVYKEWDKTLEKAIQADTGKPTAEHKVIPNITAVSPNVAFDNETFEITTQAFTTPDGGTVPADEVPVKAWGDYEFEGRGLTLRWNDVDGRLEYLEVAHGEYLVVRDAAVLGSAGSLQGSDKKKADRPAATALGWPAAFEPATPLGPAVPLRDAAGRPIQFAAKEKVPAGANLPRPTPAAAAPAPGSRPPGKGRPTGSAAHPGKAAHPAQPPYRASFDDDVRISQGERDVREAELARADLMNIDFMSGSKATTRPSTKPAGGARPTTRDAAPVAPTAPAAPAAGAPALPGVAAAQGSATGPVRVDGAGLAAATTHPAATRPATGPASKPAADPVIVRWTGKLRVVPVDPPAGGAPATGPALKPGETVVRLVGEQNPVRLTRDTSKVWCTTADYFSADDSAELRGSAKHGPVFIRQTPENATADNAAEGNAAMRNAAVAGGAAVATDGAATKPAATNPASTGGRDRHGSGSTQDATIITQQLNYSELTHVAVLHGESSAHVLLPADQKPTTRPATAPAGSDGSAAPAAVADAARPATQPAQALDAKWNREGRIYLRKSSGVGGSGDATSIEHAEFEGDVDVKHPQLALKSQQLQLYFEQHQGKPTTRPAQAAGNDDLPDADPASGTDLASAVAPAAAQPATKPSVQTVLKRMVATTDVWCDLIDASGGADKSDGAGKTGDDRSAGTDKSGQPKPAGPTTQPTAIVAKKQTITTDRLSLDTALDADGKMYPRLVQADGKTHAFDDQQDLKAGHLIVNLKPSTRPAASVAAGGGDAKAAPATKPANPGGVETAAFELESMRAWDAVAVKNGDGSTVVGQQLDVRMKDGQPVGRVVGAPLASITDASRNVVVGPVIDFDQGRQWAKVTGGGSIRANQSPDEKKDGGGKPGRGRAAQAAGTRPATRPAEKFADIFWKRDAELDGARNRIWVAGPVLIQSDDTDADGIVTHNTATGERAVIELVDGPPKPQPAGPAGLSTRRSKSATRPAKPSLFGGSGGGGAGGNPMDNKVVSAFNLLGKAVVTSTAADAGGILKQFEVKSDTLRYETGDGPVTASPLGTGPAGGSLATAGAPPAGGGARPAGASPLAMGSNDRGQLIVPGPGTMLHRDHRPPAKPAAGAASPPPDQARGVTAFRWERGMTYHQPTRAMTMLGSVVIGQQADDPQAERIRITGDRVDALFEPKPATADAKGKPDKPAGAAGAAGGTDGVASSMQPKWITLLGSVTMDRGASSLTAERADYNPASGDLIAVGTPRNPALFSNPITGQTMWADQIVWNTQTWLAKFTGVRGSASGDRPGAKPAAPPAPPARKK